MTKRRIIENPEVAAVFGSYPNDIKKKLVFLRRLIFDVASRTDGVGELEETLKWGQPSYLTTHSKSGSLVRIDRIKSHEGKYAMYFHCQTNLVETFRTLFPNDFKFEGNRAIIFQEGDIVPTDALTYCIAAALTYHRGRKSA